MSGDRLDIKNPMGGVERPRKSVEGKYEAWQERDIQYLDVYATDDQEVIGIVKEFFNEAALYQKGGYCKIVYIFRDTNNSLVPLNRLSRLPRPPGMKLPVVAAFLPDGKVNFGPFMNLIFKMISSPWALEAGIAKVDVFPISEFGSEKVKDFFDIEKES